LMEALSIDTADIGLPGAGGTHAAGVERLAREIADVLTARLARTATTSFPSSKSRSARVFQSRLARSSDLLQCASSRKTGRWRNCYR
jgi:hypothetical protein